MSEHSAEYQFREAVKELRQAISELHDVLVRKDVYASDKITIANQLASMDRTITDLERRAEKELRDLEKKVDKDIDDRRADRRLIVAAFLALVAQIIVQVYQQAQGGP